MDKPTLSFGEIMTGNIENDVREQEIWKAIVGYEGIYEISSHGFIKRVNSDKILKSCPHHKNACLGITLKKDKKKKFFTVAQLVAAAFLGKPYKNIKLFHKDKNKYNNHYLNLTTKVEENRQFCGKKFNRLTILRMIEPQDVLYKKDYQKHPHCFSVCECGTEKILPVGDIQRGNTKSCGCLAHEFRTAKKGLRFGDGVAPFRCLYRQYKCSARHKKRDFQLTVEEFKNIINKNCSYCNCEPSTVLCNPNVESDCLYYNGIDRKDSGIGYLLENSIPCCTSCNFAKSDLTEKEFLDKVEAIYNFRIKK